MTRDPRTEAPYGSWRSPVTAAGVARGEALLEWLGFVGEEVWWTEARPDQNGRSALMRRARDGTVAEALPPQWDVRSAVIEYGGRPWLALSAAGEDGIVFTHWADQRVYRWRPGTVPVPLSPAGTGGVTLRYCDFAECGDEVWCLRESVADPSGRTVARHLVALPLDGRAATAPGEVRVLAATHHFMTGPRIDPSGRRVAWLGWDHPAMPWDGTELMVADRAPDGWLTTPVKVAGGADEAITQIDWAADRSAALYAVTDPDGWWNIHRIDPDGQRCALCPRQEEFGEALWRIGLRWCLPLPDGRVAVVHGTSGRRLALLAPDGGLTDIESPYTEWHHLATDGRRIAAVAASPEHPRSVVVVDPDDGSAEVVRPAHHEYPGYASTPFRRTYRGPAGEEVHAHVHPPFSPDFTGPAAERPPFLVFVHGGPTSRSHLVLNQEITYFTSRGIGVIDVQYGGSTGFGRKYRERLRENWGIVDVRDCATAARGLIAEGLADRERIAIRGGSAGGWTAIASLIAEPELYRAAGVYYPVLDPAGWRTAGTHDFESQYLDGLIGPWPQCRDRYERRSPIRSSDRIRAPFVLFQGRQDSICPPSQAERLLESLPASSAPHRYLTFEGERHGFRMVDTIARCLQAELALYAQALRFG